MMKIKYLLIAILITFFALPAKAEVEINVSGAQRKAMKVAMPEMLGSNSNFLTKIVGGSYGDKVREVVIADLERSGLFEIIPERSYIEKIPSLDYRPSFVDWQAIKAQALVQSRIQELPGNKLKVDFRLWDAVTEQELTGKTFTSTKENDWSAEYAKNAINNGDILYAGKYRTPDFELLLSENCGLAIENTMIYHTPEIKEQLENLGIPVIVEYSSYEPHPLGRMEWIKLYGLLTGHEDEAEKLFSEKARQVENLSIDDINPDEKKSVAFFYITSSGYASVRKPNDYVSKMIELAGGKYIFTADDLNVDENALSTMNMQIESFYEKAKDADIIIYNSTIDGEIQNIQQLVEKCSVLSDFKAVKNNNAWCSEKDMFQQTGASADIIIEMNKIITGSAEDDMEFIHRIKNE